MAHKKNQIRRIAGRTTASGKHISHTVQGSRRQLYKNTFPRAFRTCKWGRKKENLAASKAISKKP
jgi:hypothetical protein